jgi:hypothetical protein
MALFVLPRDALFVRAAAPARVDPLLDPFTGIADLLARACAHHG